jgi:hypothetical protein
VKAMVRRLVVPWGGVAQACDSGQHGHMRRRSCFIAPCLMIRYECLCGTSRRRPSLFESKRTIRRMVRFRVSYRGRGEWCVVIGSIYGS